MTPYRPVSEHRPEGIVSDPADAGSAERGPTPDRPVTPIRLGFVGWLRWMWRQLTSMRVALMLLMLLAVVAVPGSVLPQRPQDPAAVGAYLQDNPTLGAWFDRLGFFDVYASVWFSAVYLLLFVSLIGCIVPRLLAHLRGWRRRPPRTPRRFDRFPATAELSVDATPDQVVDAARSVLVGPSRWFPRFRVDDGTEPAPDGSVARTVSAERGHLRESGNILFHLALLGVLVSVATGQLLHYRGQAIVVEGRGFANAVTDYDTFESGTAFDPRSLVPFTLRLDKFSAVFTEDLAARARDFVADVTVTDPDTGATRQDAIRVNHPLTAGGAKIYLQGNGYAPEVTVHDADGQVAFAGAVPFLPEDAQYLSRGVIKVPDVSTGDQIGIVGYLLPTAVVTEQGARSVYPQPDNPLLVLTVWHGDLGLDDGIPQNVYELDSTDMTQSLEEDGTETTFFVELGQTVELPDGLGTFTWEGLPRFVALDLRYDPSLTAIAVFAVLALAGLAVSLFTPRRRLWLRIRQEGAGASDTRAEAGGGGRTVVAGAALARGDDLGLEAELQRVMDAVRALDERHDDGPG